MDKNINDIFENSIFKVLGSVIKNLIYYRKNNIN